MPNKDQMRASVYTLGCRLNQSETGIIEERLGEAGYAVVPFDEPADLAVINTCTVTGEADTKARKAIRGFIRRNPEAYVAVVGCYSERDYKPIAEIKGVDLILGNRDKLNVLDYVAQGKNGTPLIVRDPIEPGDFTIEAGGGANLSRRVNLKVQDGCDFMCSFCIVPFVRGRSRSREMANLLDEAGQLVERGVKEIVLTGVNVGTYGYEGQTLVDVVNRLNDIKGLDRVRISSTEPTTIPEGLFPLMNDPGHALVPHLHIPVQSGSNAILARMKRRYTREEFLALIRRAHSAVADLCIGTDVLVGFPGEGEDDFHETCSLLDQGPIAYAHVFKYSDRQGAGAARLPGKVDPKAQNRRSARVRRITAQKRRLFHEAYIGRTVEVLFEQADHGYWYGYTGNYIRVAARSNKNLVNVIEPVTLEKPCGDFVIGTVHDD